MTEETKVAKVPPGMEIKRPEPEKQRTVKIPQKQFTLDPSLPQIQYPHYTNNDKTQLACLLIRPDGQAHKEVNIPADDNHPLYRDIKRQFTQEEIDINTAREVNIAAAMRNAIEADEKQKAREKSRADLWDVKSKFMDMDAVKNSDNKNLKRNLRKATNYFEALAFGCALIIEESNKSD